MATDEIKSSGAAQSRAVTIQNRFGIHARPAVQFVKTANRFQSEIFVENGGQRVSGRSIIGLLMLEGYQGAVLQITATGPDATEALDALEDLIQQKFFED